MKAPFIYMLAILVSLNSGAFAQKPFSIEVVPEKQTEDHSGISWVEGDRRSFYVILTNTTAESQRVFETWNSWGYQALSFEFTLPSGEKFSATMKGQNFTVNFPSTYTIKPKGSYVFKVTLNDKWLGKANFKGATGVKVKMKAVYQLSATKESKKQGVWTGVIESDELSMRINL